MPSPEEFYRVADEASLRVANEAEKAMPLRPDDAQTWATISLAWSVIAERRMNRSGIQKVQIVGEERRA